jgi:ABC-type multidrug transport system fused ATPase/permease subunit
MMSSQTINKPTYNAFRYFLGRFKLWFGAILLVTVVSSAAESLSVLAFFPIFSSLLSGSGEESGGVLGFILGLANRLPFDNPIVSAAVLLILVFLLKAGFSLTRAAVLAFATAKVQYNVKKRLVDRISGAHYQHILDNKQGTLIYNTLDAPGAVASAMENGSNMAMSILKSGAIIIILVSILPWATLAAVLMGLLYYGSVHYLSKRVSFRLGLRKADVATEQVVTINEFFNGFRHILTFTTIKRWVERFDTQNRRLSELQVKEAVWMALPRPFIELAVVALLLSVILIAWISSPGALSESLPKLGVFAVALAQLMGPITNLGAARMGLMSATANLDRVHQSLVGPMPMRHDGDKDLESFEASIRFNNVTFAYPNREPLFSGLNITFEKGKVTAIVGPSGSGKTTVINLILGLFEPTQGDVLVDGVPLKSLKQSTWLSRIGCVSQDPFTYHTTITENILLGRKGHTLESVVDAATIANAHDFIVEQPLGYNTIVGDRGLTLSGGQQQRLAIARAVLDAPEILIFDEATSSLDTMSERLVQEAIRNVSVDRTVIMIAHRLSTVRHADKIVVIEEGRLVEQGSHDELMTSQGLYSRMASTTG